MTMTPTLAATFLVVGVLLAPLAAQQPGQLVLKLPSNLTVSMPTEGRPATLVHRGAKQTFDAQAQAIAITTGEGGYVFRMSNGQFTWSTPGRNWPSTGQPAYSNTFRTLELKFESNGNWVSFEIVDR